MLLSKKNSNKLIIKNRHNDIVTKVSNRKFVWPVSLRPMGERGQSKGGVRRREREIIEGSLISSH